MRGSRLPMPGASARARSDARGDRCSLPSPVVRRFELALPDTLEACQQALADGSDVKMVAGGTDLLPQMKNGLVKPRRVVDLSALPELKVLDVRADGGL